MADRIEATGGPVECSRCGRPAPAGSPPGWASLFLNGRLVLVTCPDCLTHEERAQVGVRKGASLYEVVAARRAGGAELEPLVKRARLAGRRAPAPGWAEDLPDGAAGVVAREHEEGWLLALFSGTGRNGGQRIGFVEVETERWLGLEEVLVPAWVRERARELADAQAPGG